MKRKSVPKGKRISHPPSLPESEYQSPDWLTKMRDYYGQTGLYRARDLNRVLGDPRDQVVGKPADGLLVACGIHKR
ncbi:MAG TPA: hypothetical protein VFN27_16235 [Xanthobacteraceae bacterium]|nr:hypothetical protein [Xanthobacteraceae bacterium]